MERETRRSGVRGETASFWAGEYPLVKIFDYGSDVLIYDAKPHFAFIASREELACLTDFLQGRPPSRPDAKLSVLRTKFSALQKSGVFLKGPAAEISPVDDSAIRGQLQYFDENILLRKFCLEVTQNCNFRCTYCKRTLAQDFRGHAAVDLSEADAYRAIDYYFSRYTSFYGRLAADKRELLVRTVPPSLAFYGGEPFLNFLLIKKCVAYFKELPWQRYAIPNGALAFSSNTNLSVMNEDILRFLVDNRVSLFASLDGPAPEHDRCRVFADGRGTFAVAYENLLKIQRFNADYFRDNVSLFGVYTGRHDVAACVSFTRGIGVLRCQHFPAEYSGIFVPDPAADRVRYESALANDLADFRKKALAASQAARPDMNDFAHLFPFAEVADDEPAGENALKLLATCPMGFDNLMVAADGRFRICHKVDGAMPIGDSVTGLDFTRLADVYRRYNETINNGACKSCWNVRFCGLCAASRMKGDAFVNPTPEECDVLRLRTVYDFSCFIHLALEHPGLLTKIFDYRNDRNSFIGIVDLHDF
jgi:uncharacterized protein